MDTVISCRNLLKNFTRGKQSFTAVNNVSFDIAEGQIVGLIGPDGAGKSTILRLLTGLMKPDGGSAVVLGYDTRTGSKGIQDSIGYMPQKFGLYENLSIEENLELYASLHQVPKNERKARFQHLLEMTGLERFRTRLTGKLSGGMKSKAAIICSLTFMPRLLLLDEPTVGVDVLSRRELWQMLKKVVKENKITIFVSTSYMDEADYCDEVIILSDGKVAARTQPENIRQYAKPFVPDPNFEQGFQVLLTGHVLPKPERKHLPESDGETMIQAKGLIKRFGNFTAVNHISFEVKKGEIFGLLGANGAGKTTTFRMLCGLDAVTEGIVSVAGMDLRKASGAARNKFGYMAQKFSLYTDLTVQENLQFFGGAYGLKHDRLKRRILWAMSEFHLDEYNHVAAEYLPFGIRQRLSMACALLHEPEVLFLDEATSGADSLTRHDFWRRITQLADQGITVIITTHFMEEAEYCDRMIIMQDGEAAAQGTAEEIRRLGTPEGVTEKIRMEDAFVNIIKNHRRVKEL